ncbi:MAG: hypothetical protein M0C28_18225 [Candidatus Moduliflexus flocculans]|nr:hypothetical protein [Candidatus Moduliflexus flocculans]
MGPALGGARRREGHGERERDRLYAALVVAFAAAMLALRVVTEPIDHGYVRYAGIADAVVRSGDWIVLRLGDGPYLNKPSLFVWIIALARTLSGSARLDAARAQPARAGAARTSPRASRGGSSAAPMPRSPRPCCSSRASRC